MNEANEKGLMSVSPSIAFLSTKTIIPQYYIYLKHLRSKTKDGKIIIPIFWKDGNIDRKQFIEFSDVMIIPQDKNVFYTLNPRKKIVKRADGNISGQGKGEDIEEIIAFYADIDFISDAHQKAEYKDFSEAYQVIKNFPLKPTYIIDSGHGIQLIWLMKESIKIDKNFSKNDYEALLRGIQKMVKADNTSDISRIFRLPGTMNVKNPDKPVPCFIRESSGMEYTVDDFDFVERVYSASQRLKELTGVIPSLEKNEGSTPYGKKILENISAEIRNAEAGERHNFIRDKMLTVANWIPHEIDEAEAREALYQAASEAWKEEENEKEKMDLIDWCISTGKQQPKRKAKINDITFWQDTELQYPLSDFGLAKRFMDYMAGNVLYIPERKIFVIWNGIKWMIDEDNTILAYLFEMIYKMREQLNAVKNGMIGQFSDDKEAKKILSAFSIYQKSIESYKVMIDALKILSVLVKSSIKNFDKKENVINVENGEMALKTGIITQHKKESRLTQGIDFPYFHESSCVRWIQFLEEIFLNDQELIDFIQKAVGYTLMGTGKERLFFILHGSGKNGKTTFLQALSHVFGEYAKGIASSSIMKDGGSVYNHDFAALQGIRLLTMVEGEESGMLREAFIKQVTGRDYIRCRFLFKEYFEYIPQFTIWYGTNYKPLIKGTDEGIWDRIRLIPFDFRAENGDIDLLDKLKEEAAGILSWAVEGAIRYAKEGLQPPKKVLNSTADYRKESDTLEEFLSENFIMDKKGVFLRSEFFKMYEEWNVEILSKNKKREIEGKLKKINILPVRRMGNYFFSGISKILDDSDTEYVEDGIPE